MNKQYICSVIIYFKKSYFIIISIRNHSYDEKELRTIFFFKYLKLLEISNQLISHC